MTAELLFEYIEEFLFETGHRPSHINLTYEQYRSLAVGLMNMGLDLIFDQNSKMLFQGIPIFVSPYLSDLKCRFCGEDIIEQQDPNDEWFRACEEHLDKAKMFYLLSRGSREYEL